MHFCMTVLLKTAPDLLAQKPSRISGLTSVLMELCDAENMEVRLCWNSRLDSDVVCTSGVLQLPVLSHDSGLLLDHHNGFG